MELTDKGGLADARSTWCNSVDLCCLWLQYLTRQRLMMISTQDTMANRTKEKRNKLPISSLTYFAQTLPTNERVAFTLGSSASFVSFKLEINLIQFKILTVVTKCEAAVRAWLQATRRRFFVTGEPLVANAKTHTHTHIHFNSLWRACQLKHLEIGLFSACFISMDSGRMFLLLVIQFQRFLCLILQRS